MGETASKEQPTLLSLNPASGAKRLRTESATSLAEVLSQAEGREGRSVVRVKEAPPVSRVTSPSALPSPSTVRKKHRMEGERTCKVCGDKAVAHNFDVITCESCKTFFRRNAHKTQKPCQHGGSCDITVSSRRHCPSCRLNKCFHIGMRADLILDEAERKARMEKINYNRKKRQEAAQTQSNTQSDSQAKTNVHSHTHTDTAAVSSALVCVPDSSTPHPNPHQIPHPSSHPSPHLQLDDVESIDSLLAVDAFFANLSRPGSSYVTPDSTHILKTETQGSPDIPPHQQEALGVGKIQPQGEGRTEDQQQFMTVSSLAQAAVSNVNRDLNSSKALHLCSPSHFKQAAVSGHRDLDLSRDLDLCRDLDIDLSSRDLDPSHLTQIAASGVYRDADRRSITSTNERGHSHLSSSAFPEDSLSLLSSSGSFDSQPLFDADVDFLQSAADMLLPDVDGAYTGNDGIVLQAVMDAKTGGGDGVLPYAVGTDPTREGGIVLHAITDTQTGDIATVLPTKVLPPARGATERGDSTTVGVKTGTKRRCDCDGDGGGVKVGVMFEGVPDCLFPSDRAMYWTLTTEEQSDIRLLTVAFKEELQKTDPATIPDELVVELDCLDLKDTRCDMDHFARKLTRFLRRLPHFCSLDVTSQNTLIEANKGVMLMVIASFTYSLERQAYLNGVQAVPSRLYGEVLHNAQFATAFGQFSHALKSVLGDDCPAFALLTAYVAFDPLVSDLTDRQQVNFFRDKYSLLLKHHLDSRYSYLFSGQYLDATHTVLRQGQLVAMETPSVFSHMFK